MAEDEPVWSKAGPASFEVDGFDKCTFPLVEQIRSEHGIREVARQIPWVDGEQIDDTGLTGKVWKTRALFFNDLMDEDGIGTNPQLYPDRLEQLERIFEARKTGTLNTPFKRNIRAKAIRWERTATMDQRECESLDITWKEDNESKLDAPRAAGITAHVNLNQQIQQAVFEAERAGEGGPLWESLTTLASQLSTLINTPTEMRENIAQKCDRIVSACDMLLNSISTNEKAIGLRDPATAVAYRALWNFRNLADAAEEQAREGRPKIFVYLTTSPTSIWDLAVALGKDPAILLELNPQLEDPSDIDPRTHVNVPQ